MKKKYKLRILLMDLIFFTIFAILLIIFLPETWDYLSGKVVLKEGEDSVIQINEISDSNGPITIRNISYSSKIIGVSYLFDNSYFIGDFIDVDVTLLNDTEIKKIVDNIRLNRDSPIQRDVQLNLTKRLEPGVYTIRLSLAENPEINAQQNFIIGGSVISGDAVAEPSKGSIYGYIFFIIIIMSGVYFTFRRIINKKSEEHLVKRDRTLK